MWLKIIRQWLIGAAVTLAAPGDGIAREACPPPSDDIAKCEAEIGGRSSESAGQDWRFGEPHLADLLLDPVCRVMMRRDGVSLEAILALAAQVEGNLDRFAAQYPMPAPGAKSSPTTPKPTGSFVELVSSSMSRASNSGMGQLEAMNYAATVIMATDPTLTKEAALRVVSSLLPITDGRSSDA